jgi:hypothetical protein
MYIYENNSYRVKTYNTISKEIVTIFEGLSYDNYSINMTIPELCSYKNWKINICNKSAKH